MVPSPIIALLTDYGAQDPFVGILKGVIAGIAPEARIVDLTHDIPPGDVKRGALHLWQSVPYFPKGTIFMSVVDPGVGTSRNSIAIDTGDAIFIGPDNGLFSFVLPSKYRAWAITNRDYLLPIVGSTFHGRDIFAPAAAHVANGFSPSNLGAPLPEVTRLASPKMEFIDSHTIQGEVLYADRFGNLLTSIGRFYSCGEQQFRLLPWLNDREYSESTMVFSLVEMRLELPDGTFMPWVRTFSDLPVGEFGCLVGGSGLLEIVSYRRSAADLLGLAEGTPITLRKGIGN